MTQPLADTTTRRNPIGDADATRDYDRMTQARAQTANTEQCGMGCVESARQQRSRKFSLVSPFFARQNPTYYDKLQQALAAKCSSPA